MFEISALDIEPVLNDFGIVKKISSVKELQRYHYERENPDSKEVRLIDRIVLDDGSELVIRFKNEEDVTSELIENQSLFAERLRSGGVLSPMQYKADGKYAKWYAINGYDVIVTVEDFIHGEIKCVDADIAEKTGRLLAKMHNIAEKYNFTVDYDVLFDPFKENDLFSFEEFKSVYNGVGESDRALHQRISDKYSEYMKILSPLKNEPRYAVQSDISNCNLYKAENGDIGVFDFNNCGNNNLYCDAVMQSVFEARLMDYSEEYSDNSEAAILPAFLKGYRSERPFSEEQKKMFPYLYAIIDAFWNMDIIYDDNSLLNAYERKDFTSVHNHLERIWNRISNLSAGIKLSEVN